MQCNSIKVVKLLGGQLTNWLSILVKRAIKLNENRSILTTVYYIKKQQTRPSFADANVTRSSCRRYSFRCRSYAVVVGDLGATSPTTTSTTGRLQTFDIITDVRQRKEYQTRTQSAPRSRRQQDGSKPVPGDVSPPMSHRRHVVVVCLEGPADCR